jgi:hypothetical protein
MRPTARRSLRRYQRLSGWSVGSRPTIPLSRGSARVRCLPRQRRSVSHGRVHSCEGVSCVSLNPRVIIHLQYVDPGGRARRGAARLMRVVHGKSGVVRPAEGPPSRRAIPRLKTRTVEYRRVIRQPFREQERSYGVELATAHIALVGAYVLSPHRNSGIRPRRRKGEGLLTEAVNR